MRHINYPASRMVRLQKKKKAIKRINQASLKEDSHLSHAVTGLSAWLQRGPPRSVAKHVSPRYLSEPFLMSE